MAERNLANMFEIKVVADGKYTMRVNNRTVSHQLYKLRVNYNNEYHWHILRRYSYVRDLYEQLVTKNILRPFAFPPKVWLTNFDPAVLEARKAGFQQFFDQICKDHRAISMAIDFLRPVRRLTQAFDIKTKFTSIDISKITLDPLVEGDIEEPPICGTLKNQFLLDNLGGFQEREALRATVKYLKEKWTKKEYEAEKDKIANNPSLAVIEPEDIVNEIEEDILLASRKRLKSLKKKEDL